MAEITRGVSEKVNNLSVKELAASHIPPIEILKDTVYPTTLDRHFIEIAKDKRPGSVFMSVHFKGRDYWVPEGHPMTRLSPEVSPKDYAPGVFEGMSLYGNHIPLFEAKMQRLERSLIGRGITNLKDHLDTADFRDIILLTAEINAPTVTVDKEGNPIRAYGRPSVSVRNGSMGVGIKPDHELGAAVEFWGWAHYLDPDKSKTGLSVIASDKWKRTDQLTGKYNSSYAEGMVIGKIARDLGADEAIMLGGITDGRKSQFRKREVVDGIGEEVFYRVGRTFIFPPSDNGRLGGTSMDNFQRHIVKELGFDSKVDVVTLDDLKSGNIEAMYMNGNAVELALVKEVWYYQGLPKIGIQPDVIEIGVSDIDRHLGEYYHLQLTGHIPSLNPRFSTPINIKRGEALKTELMKYYPGWFPGV